METLQSIDRMLYTYTTLSAELQHASRDNLKHAMDILEKEDLKNELIWERYIYIRYMYSNILQKGVAL